MKKILLSTAFTILVIFPFNIYSESKNFRVKAANGLNMRSEKGKTSSIITLLPPGSAVKFIEESEEKETLGGKKGNWIKVKYLDHKGWVFSPYLNITESNDPLILYMEFLEKNDSNDLNSLVKARKKFNQIFSNNKNDADNGLRLYRQFSINSLDKIRDKYNNKLKDKSFKKKLNSNGLEVTSCEGEEYLIEKFSFYNTLLKGYNSQLINFFHVMEKVGYPYACDAGVFISWEDIRKNISVIEKYLSKYKFNPERKELEGILKGYFTDYIYGQDNTPVTDFTEERKLLPEVKKSYNNFLKFNKNSTYYKQMKNLYDLYKSNGFVRNDKVDDYIQSIENRN